MRAGTVTGVTIDGAEVSFVRRGSGPAVVLIHGMGESRYTWRLVIDGLAESFTVFAVDLPGFGDSDPPTDGDCSIEAMADWVSCFIRECVAGPAIVVCHSFGGKVGMRLCLDHSDLCAGLVLLDSAIGDVGLGLGIRLLAVPYLGEFVLRIAGQPILGRNVERRLHHTSYAVTTQDRHEYARAVSSPQTRRSYLAYLRDFVGDTAEPPASLSQQVGPIMIVWGRDDKYLGVQHGHRLAARIDQARLVVLDNCGHNPQEDRPAETVQLIRNLHGTTPSSRSAP